MIVLDESPVIQRCLASVKPLIDYWVIVDTGSTDGTPSIIRECLKEIPGELYEKPWLDFAQNRNEALTLAKNRGDYLLFIDADEYLIFHESFALPDLVSDCYFVCIQTSAKVIFYRKILIRSELNWVWEGSVHEEVKCFACRGFEILPGVINVASQEGHRSKDPDRYLKDAAILERALEKDPDDKRNLFYLGLSYKKAGKDSLALQNLEKRVARGGEYHEEVFYSMLLIAALQEDLQMPSEVFLNSYCKAFLYRPSRIEPLSGLTDYFVRTKNYILGYLVSRFALTIRRTSDLLFVHFSMYEYETLILFAECAWQIGKLNEALWALDELLAKKSLPADFRERIRGILQK
jgi:glycosyltransferase involved in cell wall biosynthesis